jgi:membrane protease YdiL (CAAX protease family)
MLETFKFFGKILILLLLGLIGAGVLAGVIFGLMQIGNIAVWIFLALFGLSMIFWVAYVETH